MKPFLLIALLLVFISISAQRRPLRQRLSTGQEVQSAPPNYSDLYYWAAHPLKHDMSDSIPAFIKEEQKDSAVDVFFIHPTTYTKNIFGAWNADINNESLNDQTDKRPILYQASVFNASCKVYAPRYRQANIKAFFTKDIEHSEALDFAYQDVKTAFEYYLSHYNNGRPLVIASHSQGSVHALRLLHDFFDNKPLQKQLVCAYVVGWPIKNEDVQAIPFCTSPDQTGCIVGWRSYRTGAGDRLLDKEGGNSLCINPITWTISTEPSPPELHKGMMGRDFNKIYPKTLSASVSSETKILWVQLPNSLDETHGLINNFHIADYNLFYMDIRENVKQRITSYLFHK